MISFIHFYTYGVAQYSTLLAFSNDYIETKTAKVRIMAINTVRELLDTYVPKKLQSRV